MYNNIVSICSDVTRLKLHRTMCTYVVLSGTDAPGAARAQTPEVGPVELNSRVEMRCRLEETGYPPAEFEWSKIDGNVRGTVGDNGDLVLENITANHAGTYQCLPVNAVGAGDAATVVLRVESGAGKMTPSSHIKATSPLAHGTAAVIKVYMKFHLTTVSWYKKHTFLQLQLPFKLKQKFHF